MSKYDSEYFFVQRSSDDRLPYLTPTPDTAVFDFRAHVLPFGSKPLMFRNGDADPPKGLPPKSALPEVLFSATDLLVSDRIRERLLHLDLPSLSLQPSIYVDEWDRWHENYWFLTFVRRFDCWDRTESDYEKDSPLKVGGEELFDVYAYRLDEDLLDKTPLPARLLFKMGGVNPPPVTIHQSIAGVLKPDANRTFDLVRLSEWQG